VRGAKTEASTSIGGAYTKKLMTLGDVLRQTRDLHRRLTRPTRMTV
jgi:hypothetical protein